MNRPGLLAGCGWKLYHSFCTKGAIVFAVHITTPPLPLRRNTPPCGSLRVKYGVWWGVYMTAWHGHGFLGDGMGWEWEGGGRREGMGVERLHTRVGVTEFTDSRLETTILDPMWLQSCVGQSDLKTSCLVILYKPQCWSRPTSYSIIYRNYPSYPQLR